MGNKELSVLIVDDQAGVRYLLEVIVKEAGHRAYTAQNGLEAVTSALTIRPDLIFMDVRMPLMGGVEALEKIKAVIPEIDVIIMTAYPSEDVVSRIRKMGALCCITKPFDVDKIKEILDNCQWKYSNANTSTIAMGSYIY